MSRVGKKPITIPSGVSVEIQGRKVSVKGSKGTLSADMPHEITAAVQGNEVTFTPASMEKRLMPNWGTAAATVRNMIEGVTKGYTIVLGLVGVGYRANTAGNKLNMTLGYSHGVEVTVPQGITLAVKDQTEITITGADKQAVGQFAAIVRGKRPPEPFKGKGVRYVGEHIVMKEGKKK